MLQPFRQFNNWFDRNALKISIILAIVASVGSFLFFYFNNQWNLDYYDAISHLNMGRKIFDNLTPGFAQLGGLWLPLTHILIAIFAWNDFLWQTGLAGALASMPVFVLSAYFIFKIIEILFEDKKSAFLGVLIYITNINILYLQTMAMMEPLFNLTIIGSIYFIIKWFKENNILYLIIGGLFVSASTLTRYEGYGLLMFSWLGVVAILFLKNKLFGGNIKKVEGNMFVFSVVAFLGIVLWSGYLGAIFGDPLHWLHPNRDIEKVATVTTSNNYQGVTIKGVRAIYYHNFHKTFFYLWNATASSVGILMLVLAVLGLIIIAYKIIRKKIHYSILIIVFLSLGTAFFLAITMYFGKSSVWSPIMYGQALFDKSQNFFDEAGIRYTLSLLPFVTIFASVVSLGRWYKKVLLLVFIIFQVVTIFIGPLFLIYNLPIKWRSVYAKEIKSASWMKSNYDGGLILCSAIAHETEMFKNAIAYKNYIHEGTGKYWKESLNNPAKYATWIIMNKEVKTGTSGVWGKDIVAKKLLNSKTLQSKFDLIYDDGTTQIYKIKDKPLIDLSKKILENK